MSEWKKHILVVLLLAAATLAAHGWSLGDGLFLDDHWHRLRYAENDWSWKALVEAATIKPDRFISMWWKDRPLEWWYIRPVSVAVPKLVYHLSGGSVKALHGLSLLLHVANALLVYRLCLLLTRRRFWSVVGGLLLVVYSHGLYAVAWLASQNVVLGTTLALSCLLCYVRAGGLDLDMARPLAPEPACAPLRRGWFAAAMILWCLALLTRELAIVVPAFLVGFDLAFGGWRHLRARLPGYVLMAVIGGAFLLWRVVFFEHPMPDYYVRRPDGPGYIAWWLGKLLHYVTSTVWLSPMSVGPSGRFNPWTEAPGDAALMLGILGVMGSGYYLGTRAARGWWLWPAWIVLTLLPVVAIVAFPHNGYLPAVGFAVAMILPAALHGRIPQTAHGRWGRPVAMWFLIATTTYMPIYRTMWHSFLAAEKLTVECVAADPPPLAARELFFINLPFANIYAKYHLQEVLTDLRPDVSLPPGGYNVHVLTYATNALRMEGKASIEQVGTHALRVTTDGRGYFSGALGRFLIEAMRTGGPFKAGQVVRAPGLPFEAMIRRADEQGVQEIEFHFGQPLASPEYAFYFGTSDCPAALVRFNGGVEFACPENPHFAALRHARDGLFRIRETASRIIQTDLYLTGAPYPSAR